MEIKDVFSAQPKSVWEYLCENGQGLYIPAYQRHYSWGKNQIERLIEDACHGFSMLIDRKDAITFIGTIIAIHDTELSTVAPIVRGDVPAKVMTIIDGQQRLSTLLLINTVLHEEIKLRSKKLDYSEDCQSWLLEECMKTISRLGKTFEEDKDYGDDEYKYYPRMIRSYDDSWSRKKDKASYLSPIGNYLHEYGKKVRSDGVEPFKYSPPEQVLDQEKYEALQQARLVIQSLLRGVAKAFNKKDGSIEVPDYSAITESTIFQNTLLKTEIPEDVKVYLEGEDEHYKELLRLVLFANFILDRIAVTIVTAKNEDYAFDMFESLNTTGEPLTAFETFKPRVIYSEGLDKYKDSVSFGYIEKTQSFLESFKPKDKQDATSRLIISFALAERGKKLPKRLSDQRRFLRDSYEEDENLLSRRNFVIHLAHTSTFMKKMWPNDKKERSDLDFTDNELALLCISFLRQFNHTITIAPLVRFYSEILTAKSEERPAAIKSFIEALQAVVAFSVFWRSSRKGTGSIDSVYREIMLSGCKEVGLQPLSRALSKGDLNVLLLKQALFYFLKVKGGISSKDDWLSKASKLPMYDVQSVVGKFMLLCAAHDGAVDNERPGLTKKGKDGLLPLLNFNTWQNQTIEHVAPQERSNGWETSIYDESENLGRLGNLTLLPQAENSSAGNRSWSHKRLFYKLLSAETQNDLDLLRHQGESQGIKFSSSTNHLLQNSKFLPMLKSVSNVDGEWTTLLIDERSRNIATLAWDRISPWLDIPNDF